MRGVGPVGALSPRPPPPPRPPPLAAGGAFLAASCPEACLRGMKNNPPATTAAETIDPYTRAFTLNLPSRKKSRDTLLLKNCRQRLCAPLLFLGVRVGRTGKNPSSVWQRHRTRVAGVGGVLGVGPGDADGVALLEGVLGPAVPGQTVGRSAFALPGCNGPGFVILHVQINPDVR